MPTNDFKQLASSVGANVATQANYAANSSLQNNGFASGVVDSLMFNKALRQSSGIAAMIAQFIADNQASNVADDGNLVTLEAQFLAATKSVIKSQGLQPSTVTPIATSTTLTAADAGKQFAISGTPGAFTITLPLAAAMKLGDRIEIHNISATNIVVSRQGTEFIYPGSSGAASFTLQPGDSVVLTANNVSGNYWLASGNGTLWGQNRFASSLAGQGYQKLPSGLIVQFGSVVAGAAGQTGYSFPLTFPSALVAVATSVVISTGSIGVIGVASSSGTGCNIYNPNASSYITNIIAIGF